MNLSQEDLKAIAADPKAFLSKGRKAEQCVRVKLWQIENLKQISTQITTTIKPVTAYMGPGDKVGDCAAAIVDLTRELYADIADLVKQQRQIKTAIYRFSPTTQCRVVLESRYLAGLAWEAIACETHYAYRWVLRLHGHGLRAMRERATEELKCRFT